ncbi:MAG: hydroxymethylbilane synthase [Dokdonella sp.]|uniref:hydroxymethylbilane synthase n=1 Tax=Dokdonella sp. TaxID=2291710 RepID=UPI003265771E
MKTLRIATRQSALALWQAEHVAARLRVLHTGLLVELVPMTTRGDQILDRPLSQVGGKGLFLKELEVAMIEHRADIAVHSFKDVPMDIEPGFEIGAVLDRADPADAFISGRYRRFDELPHAARVGTSSLRRQAQVRALRPDLQLVDLRGNVNTRLAKLDAGDYDAIILACAGIERLGFGTRIAARLAPPEWVPAVAQGAIAVECRVGDSEVLDLVAGLNDPSTHRCVTAERAMNRKLHGSCTVPIAGYCIETEKGLALWGLVGDAKNGQLVRAQAEGDADNPQSVGEKVAEGLMEQGAGEILARL